MIVYIEETNSMADVTFPSLPHVVSLLHYDDVTRTTDSLHPPAGYPVICVTVSSTKTVNSNNARETVTQQTTVQFLGFFCNDVAGPNQDPHPLGVEGLLLSLRTHTFLQPKLSCPFVVGQSVHKRHIIQFSRPQSLYENHFHY